jgi:hypothetical protein
VILLDFVKNGVLNGSKEVALAAINCLQTFVGSNCPKVSSVVEIACTGSVTYSKYYFIYESIRDTHFIVSWLCFQGNLESSHVKSVLDIYEVVLQTSPNYKNDSTDKVKQEVLRGLGNLQTFYVLFRALDVTISY